MRRLESHNIIDVSNSKRLTLDRNESRDMMKEVSDERNRNRELGRNLKVTNKLISSSRARTLSVGIVFPPCGIRTPECGPSAMALRQAPVGWMPQV